MTIQQEYEKAVATPHNISEHLETLRQLASECQHVTEFGVDKVTSTYAFLVGCKGKIVSYDIRQHRNVERVLKTCREEGIDWTFIEASDIEVDIEPTDMLFVDSFHTGYHLRKIFTRHADKVRKYIVLHDTVTFGERGNCGGDGLWHVVEEFVAEGKWRILKHYTHCNGLTVLVPV